MTKEMEEALKLQEKSTLEEESKAPEQYGQLLLPSIKVKNTSVSKNVGRRVAFLWSTAHQMLAVSPLIAHEMMYVYNRYFSFGVPNLNALND
jgi:hypothetical protein